ncbi:LLM class F420-dependent oxidoreductase [Amycolatopsis sp. NPDC051903]|uniref:LLM class F420-dependent oxidoreductase n=1 Tax=Amycolatopsis sp. NPDC051903 TaxID=3363936 RepID=UPI0037B439B2
MTEPFVRGRSPRPVRIAVQLHPQHAPYRLLRDAVRRAEALGVDAVFTWDHFFPLYGPPTGQHFECWTTLAAWAEQTTTVHIGPMVSCVAFRNPHLLADMARTVDHVSGGRLVLGLGAGWSEADFTGFGYPVKPAGELIDDLATALPVIRERLHGPDRGPVGHVPVMIGGAGERKTLPLVARHADIWHSFSVKDELVPRITLLRGYCAEIGRDFDEIEVAVAVGGGGRDWRAPGAPDRWGEPLRQAGASLFTLAVGGARYDLTEVQAWLDWRDRVSG